MANNMILVLLALLHATSCSCVCGASVPTNTTHSPFLPPLLRFNNGTTVDTPHAWHSARGRRAEVQGLVQDVLLGRVPSGGRCSQTPPLLAARVLNSTAHGASRASFIHLTFGIREHSNETATPSQDVNVSFTIEVLTPPLSMGLLAPVFLTQWTHRPWALLGLERGYIGLMYPAADGHQNGRPPYGPTDVAPAFQAAYCTVCGLCGAKAWALIAARAWVASRALDYVFAHMPGADTGRVCIAGTQCHVVCPTLGCHANLVCLLPCLCCHASAAMPLHVVQRECFCECYSNSSITQTLALPKQ